MKFTKLIFMAFTLIMLNGCEKPRDETTTAPTTSQIQGMWYATACNGDTQAIKWYFGTDGRGYLSTKDCNGICGPIVLNFSYTVSGSSLTCVYDAVQPVVHCTGYNDNTPSSPGTQTFPFDLNGNTLTVSSGGTTTVFVRSTTGGGTGGNGSGSAVFWVASDLGHGNITVTCNGSTQVISSYYNGMPSCGASGCANFDLNPGTYSFTAVAGSYSWNGTITVTSGGCFKEQLTGSGGGTAGNNGNLTVWTQTDHGCGNISVNVNGQTGYVTSYYTSGVPSCGSTGCANFSLPAGTYSISASCQTLTWSGTATVTSGGCCTLKLN